MFVDDGGEECGADCGLVPGEFLELDEGVDDAVGLRGGDAVVVAVGFLGLGC